MNSNEISDASQNNSTMSNRYLRYPLANDPQMTMRNTNYKEWLNMCDSNTQFVGDISTYSSPEAALSVREAVLTGIKSVGTILSNLGVPLARQSFEMISRLIGVLWSGPNPFEALMVLVEELINQRITQSIRDAALLELRGLQSIMDLYRIRLNTWLNNDTDGNRRAVEAQYRVVDNFFIQNMPRFGREDHGVLLLPVYAQAANLHLILLRDADHFGGEWGLDPDEIRDNYIRLQGLIRQYKDHCVTFYNRGLNLFNRSGAQDWVRFNRFRTDMTLTVLDLATLFPNYDPRIYPSAVKTELTREVYTDPVGYTERGLPWYSPNNTTFATMENSARRRPSFSTWINRIRVFTGHLGNFSAVRNVWGGHELFENLSDGSEIMHRFGNTNSSNTAVQSISFQNLSVFSIDSIAHVLAVGTQADSFRQSQYGVSRATFHTSNINNVPGSLRYEVPNVNVPQTILSELPGENEQRPNAGAFSHRLSYISNFDAHRGGTVGSGNVSLLTYGWTHTSMDRNNRLESDRITQIDAVKGSGGVAGSVIPGPTGGNLVRVFDGHSWVRLRVQAPQIQTDYRIRLRYACVNPTLNRIWVEHSGNAHAVELPCNGAASNPSDTLPESAFRYITVPGIFRPSINPTINFLGISQGSILDKIEFIPLNIFSNLSLETSEKAVDDLFIN